MQQHRSFLTLLVEAEPMQRKAMLRAATPAQIRAVIECVKHALTMVPPADAANIRQHLEKLLSDHAPFRAKTKIIAQHGGSLAYLIGPLISGLYNLLY